MKRAELAAAVLAADSAEPELPKLKPHFISARHFAYLQVSDFEVILRGVGGGFGPRTVHGLSTEAQRANFWPCCEANCGRLAVSGVPPLPHLASGVCLSVIGLLHGREPVRPDLAPGLRRGR